MHNACFRSIGNDRTAYLLRKKPDKFLNDWLYHTCVFLQRVVMRLFANWKVNGVENVPPMGPLIIIANHQSNFDPPLLSASLPRRIYFLAKSGLFMGFGVNWFLRSYGAHPVDREGADIAAYRWVLKQLRDGKPVVLFPEGMRSRGAMSRAKPGIAQIALQSQATILPVGIVGTERLGTWMRVFNPTGNITVNIGQVFSIPPIEGRPSRALLDSITDMIMQRVAVQIPEEYRGVYGSRPEGAPPQENEKCAAS